MIVNRYTLVIDVPNTVGSGALVDEILANLQYLYGPDVAAIQLVDSQLHIEVDDNE